MSLEIMNKITMAKYGHIAKMNVGTDESSYYLMLAIHSIQIAKPLTMSAQLSTCIVDIKCCTIILVRYLFQF